MLIDRANIIDEFNVIETEEPVRARSLIKRLDYKHDHHLLHCIAMTYLDEAQFDENGEWRYLADSRKLRMAERYIVRAFKIKPTYKEKAEANYNKPLVAKLDSIYQDDQSYRKQINAIEKEFGNKSKEMEALWKTINEKDSLNLIKVTSILDKYGWLGADVVGPQGNMTLFLVIQHSDQATQEKYLPMMREAVKNGKAQASSLSLLEDRVALGQGKRQVYGSQVGRNPETQKYYILPLEDPDNVDKRRASVGLQPLGEYVIRWNIKWDVEQYKKDLPAIESKQNIK